MSKLGVCVVLNNNNFGSMLQSFATQKILQKHGIDYELIRYNKKKNFSMLLRLLDPIMWSDKVILAKRKFNILLHKDIKANAHIREKKFDAFRKEHFTNMAPVCNGYEELVKAGTKYDAYMVGSDQLWSPSGLKTNFYNLMFVADEKYKFSYAASFGVPAIQENQRKETAQYLNRIQDISVRENSGAKIVEELSGRQAQVVVDPTLLFDGAEWKSLIPEKRIIEEPYILVYLLGENNQQREMIKQLKHRTNKKIVLVPMERLYKQNKGLADIESYSWGPEEFVNLIRFADYVCTDSFHGMVFSTLYHKKFIVFNRYENEAKDSKNTRIDSFCENYGLTARRYKQNSFLEDMEKEIDYAAVEEKIREARKNSLSFLEHSIGMIR